MPLPWLLKTFINLTNDWAFVWCPSCSFYRRKNGTVLIHESRNANNQTWKLLSAILNPMAFIFVRRSLSYPKFELRFACVNTSSFSCKSHTSWYLHEHSFSNRGTRWKCRIVVPAVTAHLWRPTKWRLSHPNPFKFGRKYPQIGSIKNPK